MATTPMIMCESEPGDIKKEARRRIRMAGRWLAKQEPSGPRGYSIGDLRRDGRTVWDGVHNNLALKHMRNMRKGDRILFYHTGTERRAVGVMRVVSDPYPNPEEANARFIVVDVEYADALRRPVTLDEMKRRPDFAGWELLRISRLSVMPVPEQIWDAIVAMSETAP